MRLRGGEGCAAWQEGAEKGFGQTIPVISKPRSRKGRGVSAQGWGRYT
jgi:hypothetical protein